MCLFKKKVVTAPVTTPISVSVAPTPVVLPYPEESPDFTQTVGNTSATTVLANWFSQRNVPAQYQDYFRTAIDIQIYDTWTPDILSKYPNVANAAAFVTTDTIRHLYILAPYVNVGVISYEEAHVAFMLLTDIQKNDYATTFNQLKNIDPLLIELFNEHPLELTADAGFDPRIVGHAEIYRCIGDKMNSLLKPFYPRLF